MFYRGWKGKKHQTTILTTLAKLYNKIAQIELTLLAMFVFVSCFPLALINVSKQVSINRLFSTLTRRRTWAFSFWILKFRTQTHFYSYAHTVRRKTFAQVVVSARRFCQNGASESCQLRLDLVLSKIPYQ
jgi:hypothetical protein